MWTQAGEKRGLEILLEYINKFSLFGWKLILRLSAFLLSCISKFVNAYQYCQAQNLYLQDS